MAPPVAARVGGHEGHTASLDADRRQDTSRARAARESLVERDAVRHRARAHDLGYVTQDAYSHECISAGWWPGGGAVDDAAFYAYAYPEPAGCDVAPIQPSGASYHPALHEWVLPYETVRQSTVPEAALHAFLQSTYDAAATLGQWDKTATIAAIPFAAAPR